MRINIRNTRAQTHRLSSRINLRIKNPLWIEYVMLKFTVGLSEWCPLALLRHGACTPKKKKNDMIRVLVLVYVSVISFATSYFLRCLCHTHTHTNPIISIRFVYYMLQKSTVKRAQVFNLSIWNSSATKIKLLNHSIDDWNVSLSAQSGAQTFDSFDSDSYI